MDRGSKARGFTILELLVAIAIVAILGGLLIVVFSRLRQRAERVQCIANLKSLYLGTELYIQQNGSWPQIEALANKGKSSEEKAALWISALEPFSVPRKTWICPSIQNFLGNPDYTQAENARLDYGMTAFDDKPTTPHQWPRQPWFMERGDVHGNGNLIIFADGSISDVKTEVAKARSGK